MKSNLCLFERFSKLSIGIVLLTFSLIMAISGFTVLPVFGIIVAVPFFLVAIYFLRAHLNRECQLE
jgi:hypothetical protein